ncbi:glucuronate isomerase [Alteribacillus bidgolensis]|uniref:Uronate isomerase n=1 Tax=Alteribacillus bidgolensis TaxID=930129 RepID=A0A1G8I408_9BACI|nr:glucuronate isomerase [Alteribacillus bidgolensis]SDI13584.1 D-glucuronate isomerase [Alteribacillus bidgolensis]
MKTFISEDFLLEGETAKELYHNYAKQMPIIDYHNHLVPEEILEDKNYKDIAEIWLAGDHYKWRAMRANGIHESFITGDKTNYEKFEAWAATVPKLLGNPLYHWTHLELQRYFGIDELLDETTAPAIWKEANDKLQQSDFSVRSLLKRDNVTFVGTTDDPADDLAAHKQLHEEGFDVTVSPSFRPDKGLKIEKAGFGEWRKALEHAAGFSIETYDDLLKAFSKRVNYFDALGCRSADHGITAMFYEPAAKADAEYVFEKRLNEEELTTKEIGQYKTYTLFSLAEMYAEKGWVMQLHIGALRNNNTKMFEKLGPDSGFDSIGDDLLARPLSRFLDSLEKKNVLPKTVLYSLDARDNYILATAAGNYQNDEVPGKIQFGTAWWFNDHIDGMENQMKILANTGLISNFIGMLTDSRSFLSFSRHEYFRRILCNLLGGWVDRGRAPKDMELLKKYVQDICYYNAKRYFKC